VPVVTVRTRQAADADLVAVVDLWDELRGSGGRLGPFGPPASTAAVQERLSALGRDPAHRVTVAEIDDKVVGLAVLSRLPITPISEVESIQISFMHVSNDRRRRGVGRAIVEAAATFATEVGAEYVTVGVFPGSRDTNRYFARLGFTPLVVRRAIATSLLQRRLAGESGVREVLTRRRRGRQFTGD
jgi:predicted N-acetyltransferase YhbS